MPKFSIQGERKLKTCHSELQRLFYKVVETTDCSILEGHRGQARQHQAYTTGASQLDWPHSKHNSDPSMAVDVAPYPIDWKDIKRFKEFGKIVQGVADSLGIKVRWGATFSFKDYPHWELI